MHITGWAFKSDEKQLAEENSERYDEIVALRPHLNLTKDSGYNTVRFKGVINDETAHLSEKDLALIADDGNLCFGGYCVKSDTSFHGEYYTD
jgi:hypothetical protein